MIDARFFPLCELERIESVSIVFRRKVIIRHAKSRARKEGTRRGVVMIPNLRFRRF
jgi:hypothetical protein